MDYPSGYGIVFREYLKTTDLTPQAKGLYALLASYTGDKAVCWPSQNTMASDMNVERKAIIRWLGELETFGLVKTEHSDGSVNKYKLVIPEPVPPVGQGSPMDGTGGVLPVGHRRLTTKNNNKNNVSDASRKHIIGVYINLYKEKTGGSEPRIDGCTIGQIDKLLAKKNEDEIVMVLDRYFKNGFWYTKSGFSFKNMFYHYDEILSSMPKKSTATEWQCPECGKEATGNMNGARYCVHCKTAAVEVEV